MKKFMTLAMIAAMSLGLVACGGSSKKDSTDVEYLIEADEGDDSLDELRSEFFEELNQENATASKTNTKVEDGKVPLSDIPIKDSWGWTTVENVNTNSGETLASAYTFNHSGRYVDFDVTDYDFTSLHLIYEPWPKYDEDTDYSLIVYGDPDHIYSNNGSQIRLADYSQKVYKDDEPVEIIVDISGYRTVQIEMSKGKNAKYDNDKIYIYHAYFE